MSRYFGILCLLLGLVLGGCSPDYPDASATGPTNKPTAIQTTNTPRILTPTPSPLPNPTPILFSPMPTPSPTHLPTETPNPTATPVAWGTIALDPDNVSSMVQRVVWGRGAPEESAFTADGSVFIQDTPLGVYIYQAENLLLIRFLPEAREFHLAPAGDILFANFPDGSIQVIDLPAGTTRHVLTPIASLSPWMNDAVYSRLPADRPAMEAMFFEIITTMNAIAISPDGRLAAIGFGALPGDASLGLWDLETGLLVRQLRTNIVQFVSQLVFSPNGEKLLSVGNDGEIAVWQVADGQLLWRLPNIGHIVGQPFSPDGSLLALEIDTGDPSDILSWVAVRDARFGGEQGSQVVGTVASNSISSDNTRLLTTWWGTVSIWTIPNLQLVDTIRTDLDWPRASFSTDGRYILLDEGQQAYRVSDLSLDRSYPQPTPRTVPQVDFLTLQQIGHFSGSLGLRYPQAQQVFAWGTNSDHEAWVWDLANNTHTSYDFGGLFMADPDLSFNGDRLAACTDSGLMVVSVEDGQSSNLGRCRASGVVRFSVDGGTIFRTNGLLVDALDSTTGELLYNLRWHEFNVESLAVTQDGAYLISSSNFQYMRGREVIWWHLEQPTRLWDWWVNVYPDEYLLGAVFQQDDFVLHTALGGLRSWRLSDGIQHHLDTNRIASLTISPDQRILASGDINGIIHIWSLESWQEVATHIGHRDTINGLAVSPDGTGLLSLSMDGTIRLWGLP
jgi:WD40 repeat protein